MTGKVTMNDALLLQETLLKAIAAVCYIITNGFLIQRFTIIIAGN